MINMKDLIKKQGDMLRKESGMNMITEKKKMDQKYLDKIHKLTQYNNHTESRILVAKLVGDKKLMKAYEGLKAVQDYMGRANEIIKPRTYLDLKLKDAIGRKFLNSAEIWGLL